MKSFDEIVKNRKDNKGQAQNSAANSLKDSSRSFDRIMAERNKAKIVSEVNSLVKNRERIAEEYHSRYFDDKGNFIQKYRSDSGDWLNKVSRSKSTLSRQENDVKYMLSKYGKYYDDEFLDNINAAVDSDTNTIKDIVDFSATDNDYWSQWKDEDAYKRDYDHQTYSQKYAKSSYADLQKAKTDIEERLRTDRRASSDELNRELYWLQNHDTDRQYVDSMSIEDLETIKGKDKEKQKALVAEKAELTRQKAKIESQANGRNVSRNTSYNNILTRINEIDKELGKTESSVLYYDDVGAVTADDVIKEKKYADFYNGTIKDGRVKSAYEMALQAQENIDNLSAEITELQEIQRKVPSDAVNTEIMGKVNAINTNKAVIAQFDALGYDFADIEYSKRERENRAKVVEQKKADAKYATEHPVKATLKSIATSPVNAVEFMANLVDSSVYGYSNVYDDRYTQRNESYTGTVGQNINDAVMERTDSELLSWLASGTYSGLTSSAQSALTTGACMLMFGAAGANVALGIMGTEAAASSYRNAVLNGSTNGEAILTATASGVAEALFEKVSLDNLLEIGKMYDTTSMSALLKSMIKNSGATFVQGLTEASEEFLTEIANKFADEIINGDHSAYNTAIAKYKKMGYSDTDAKEIASKDAINDVLSSLYGGFIGGIGSGMGASAVQGTKAGAVATLNDIRTNQYYNQAGQNIIDNNNVPQLVEQAQGLGNDKSLKSTQRLANEVSGINAEGLDTKGNKKYAKQVGKLYKGVTEAQLQQISKAQASETETNSFREVVKAELESAGIENADAIADVIVKKDLHNEKLTRAESNIYNSVNSRAVVDRVLRSENFTTDEGSSLAQAKETYISTRDSAKFNIGKMIKARVLAETDYDISSDGRTTIEASGEEVESMVISSLDGDDISLTVKVGDKTEIVSASELKLNDDYAIIFEAINGLKNDVGIDDSSASKLFSLWEKFDGSSVDFGAAIKSGFTYGQYNMRNDFEKDDFVMKMPEAIRESIFEIGREYRQRVVDEQELLVKGKDNTLANAKDGEFSIAFVEGVSYETLNKSQKAQVDYAQVIAQAFGFNLEIFRSPKNALGQSTGENGSYSVNVRENGKNKSNTMRLDIDAGTLNGKSLIIFTQAHELTHFIKAWSPKSFKTFADLLVEKYGKNGVSVDDLVKNKIKESRKIAMADKTGTRKAFTYDEAFEEVVCDACEDFLADPNIQQTIVEFAKVDESLVQKIKEFLKNIIAKLEEAIKGLQGQSEAAELLRGFAVEDLNELKGYWTAALFDARENVLNASNKDAKAEKNTTDEGDVKEQARFKGHPNIDKSSHNQDNISRANKQGDFINEFYNALTKSEWRNFYNALAYEGYLPKTKIGEIAPIVMGNKLVVSERIHIGKKGAHDFVVTDVYKLIGNESNYILYELKDIIEERGNGYDTERIRQAFMRTRQIFDGQEILARYDRSSRKFDVDFNKTELRKSGSRVQDNSGDLKDRGRGLQQNKQTNQRDEEILKRSDRNTDIYSRINETQNEVNQLRLSIHEIEMSDEFKAEQRKLSEAFAGDIDNAVKLYTQWLENSEYGKLKSRKDVLEEELDKLRKKAQDDYLNKALEEEKLAIEKSGLSEADYFRKQAVKEFGYTPYFYDAGYITPNGKMLNFSGEKGKHYGSRGQDHRAIGIIYEATEGTDALNRFVKDGNIRIMAESPGIDVSIVVEPTKEQYSTIKKFISEYANREFFGVDLTDENGKVIGSLQYEGRINPTRILNDIKHYYATGEIREQSSIGKFLYSDRVAVNQSMTMDEAKQMVQRAFVLGNIYECYDGEYKNGDEWLREQGVDEVALYIENEYALQQKYLDKIQGILDEEFYVQDILDAYLNGTLVGNEKPKAKRLDVSKNYRINDTRFYSPKRIETVKQLFEIAGQKLTSKNRAEVSSARAKILLFAHNKGASELLGLSQAELNKKLRSWSGYTNGAREASAKLNKDVADSNKWTGIENCSWLYKNEVTTEELESLVKNIEGAADDYEKMYIARTMLALDTHIDWSWLSFKFDTYANVNNNSISKCNGYYLDKYKKIVVSHNKPNTVAHEMGHALDYQWARDLGFAQALTDVSRTTEKNMDAETRQFFDNFKVFIDSLTDNGDIRSEYTQDPKEVFARFVARFVQWVDNTGGNRSYTTEVDYYNDKFTATNYIEFVKLLQEKAMLDAKRMSKDTLEDVKFQDRNYAPTFYSQMGIVIEATKQEKLGASSVVPMLKGKGIKNEEIKWSGIEEFLEGKKSVTKQELQEFIAGSMLQSEEETLRITNLDEIDKKFKEYTGDSLSDLYDDIYKFDADSFLETLYWSYFEYGFVNKEQYKELERLAKETEIGTTKWHEYRLPDGENYRELIFKMPKSSYTNKMMKTHWGERAEGVLAHARIQDFVVDGKKMLFIEEIQSDWHNEGNKRGYAKKLSPSESKKVAELLETQELLVKQMQEKYQKGDFDGAMQLFEQEKKAQLERTKIAGTTDGVTDAPFKDNYHEYVLKRLLRMAAEEGYDSIGWTPAEIQSERWSSEYAEGYRIEYDQDIPKFLNKYGKKWGAKVSTTYLPTVTEQHQDETDATEVWSMDITDSMKESVLYEGQTLYQDRPYQPSPEDLGIDYKAENDKLKADVERLKEMIKLQKTLTHGALFTKTSVEKAASLIMREFDLHRGKPELANKLNALYTFMASSDDLTWDEIYDRASQIANWIIDSKPEKFYYKNPYASEILKDIRERGVTFNEKQKEEAAYLAGSFNAYRKMNIGNFKIVNEGGISLTDLWEQLVNDYPGAINQESIEKGKIDTNLPSLIVELIEDMRQTESVLEQMDRTQEVRKMVEKIYDTYWNVTTLHTLADKHQKEINLLKGKHRAEMDALKEKTDTKVKNTKEYYREMLQKVRADKDSKMEAYKERVQEQKKKNVEGRNKTATKNKIKRVIKTLESLYSNPTKEKNVKKEFQDMVAKSLVMADVIFNDGNISSTDILLGEITVRMSPKEAETLKKWKEAYEARQKNRNRLDALEDSNKVSPELHEELLNNISKCNNKLNRFAKELSDVVEAERGNRNNDVVQSAVDSLAKAYRSLKDSPESYASAAYNEYVDKRLTALQDSLEGVTPKSITQTQLDELYQAYKMVLTTVRTANDIFIKNKRMSVTDMGEAVIREVENVVKPTNDKIAALRHIRKYSWEELKPIYAFERIGSSTLMKLFKEARRGEDVFANDIADARNFFRSKNKAYGYDSWDFDERKEFVVPGGRTFSISLQEIMSIYAYSKREQALDHMVKGGFVFDESKLFTDNKKKGLKGVLNRQRTTVEAYRLNDEVFYKIINSLTKEQKKFVDDMQEYLSSVMGDKGNEVSRILYGIDLFKEDFYFPLVSSKDFIQQTNNPAGEVALKNSGMAKATVPHAKNPIVLKGFMDVWAGHVNKMSTYHAFVLPIENLNKVHNYTGFARDNHSVSVQTILAGAYGTEVNDYISNFITDLNGGVKVQSSGGLPIQLINKFKKTAVAASTSVIVQQPTAVLRAMALIDGKYFVHGTDGLKHNEAWEELKKYAPIAILKEMGGFDVGSGKQVADFITAKSYEGIKDKAKGFFTDSAYRDEALMWGASKADEIGWITIWNAVKKEIADTTTHKKGSIEFVEACGERFTEVVTYTQVYDSVFSRSGFMRNKGEISKMATAFMGEPTTSFNMLYNAILQRKRGNIGKGEVAKIIGATLASIIAAAIAKSFIYALRDDDEDEAYVEKYTQALTGSLMDDLFIPNMLPYVKDLTSLLQGWDVERTDMAIVKDIKDAFDGLDSSSKSDYRKAEDLIGAIASVFGIPAKNLMRTGRQIYNLFENLFDEDTLATSDVGNAAYESVFGEITASDMNEQLNKGKTDKAKETMQKLISEKVESGKTEKEAKSALKSSVTSYWKPLYLEAYKKGDTNEMYRIRKLLASLGLYDSTADTCSNWIKSSKDN